jgi:cytochrome c2
LEGIVRRYLPTFILLFILLLAGGLAVSDAFGTPATTRGGYVPTSSADPATASLEAWIFFIALGVIVTGTIGTGIILAITFYRLTLMIARHPAPAEVRSAAPKSNTNDTGLGIPLSNPRSVAIFWVVVALLIVGFQALRYLQQPISVAPFGYIPGAAVLSTPLFRLPGTHINGLPAFIAGPGDNVLAIHGLLAVLGLAIVGVAAVGFGLAQASRASNTPSGMPTSSNPHPARSSHRSSSSASPTCARPKQLPGNPIDTFLIAINVGLFVVIAGIIAFYVLPSYSGVAAVDNAIEATRVAALAPPTATAGPGAPQPGDLMQAEFDKLPAGSADAGQTVFQGSGGCSACHSLVEGQTVVGPSQHGIKDRAATRKPGYSAEAYLYESITNPNVYVVEGFQSNIMPQTFKDTLGPQQIADVIAFLKTQ